MDRLNNCCAWCSSRDNLQFDCRMPKGREHHGKSLYDRMRFYFREFHSGNLQLLCKKCHQQKSTQDKADIQFAATAELIAAAEREALPFRQDIWPNTDHKPKPQPVAPPETWEEKCARFRSKLGL